MIPILITISNNVVENAVICVTADELENRFADEILEHGIEPTDEDFDNGYFEFEDGSSVCMTWAEKNTVIPTGKRTL